MLKSEKTFSIPNQVDNRRLMIIELELLAEEECLNVGKVANVYSQSPDQLNGNSV